ncbi:hypothetical protein EGM92_32555, partial [Enterobacter cloacae]
MNIRRHEEAVGVFQLAHAFRHCHGFCRGGRFIQQRRRGDVETGQIQGHLLEVQQRFQTALGHFRLIGGIRGIPARVFQHVAQDHRDVFGVLLQQVDTTGEVHDYSALMTELKSRKVVVSVAADF